MADKKRKLLILLDETKTETHDALYDFFCETNKEFALKYGTPEEVPYDDAYKQRMNDFFEPIGIIPYPEVYDKMR